jgi:translation initiation factor 1 (eIF-1/SUI1)
MDFFNINNENILKEEKEQNIIIWTRKPKKTINTCMTGWNIDNTKLKEIHKSMKKKLGCSGTLRKEFIFDSIDKVNVFTLSKDCVNDIITMLVKIY